MSHHTKPEMTAGAGNRTLFTRSQVSTLHKRTIIDSFLIIVFNQHLEVFHYILADCAILTEPTPILSCEDNTLTWYTDITCGAAVVKIPSDLHQRLRDRLLLESKYPILRLVIINKINSNFSSSTSYASQFSTTVRPTRRRKKNF